MKDRFDSTARLPGDPARVQERPPVDRTSRSGGPPSGAAPDRAEAGAGARPSREMVSLSTSGDRAGFDPAAGLPESAPPRRASRRWSSPPAPINGEPIPFARLGALREADERALLGGRGEPRLHAVGGFHPEREPLVLVHGIADDPSRLAELAQQFQDSDRYQVYVLAYDDQGSHTSQSGHGLASELERLSRHQHALGGHHDLTVVAHSMGGLVTRQALNDLTNPAAEHDVIRSFGQVRVIAADTPWHGFGPSGQTDEMTTRMVGQVTDGRLFGATPGLFDMMSGSRLFQGRPDDPRDGLLERPLAPNVAMEVVFADETNVTAGTGAGSRLEGLPRSVVAHYTRGTPVGQIPTDALGRPTTGADPRGMNQQQTNFWHGLRQSSQFPAFDRELGDLARAGRLDTAAVQGAIERHFPRFEGDHAGMLTGSGEGSFIRHVVQRLDP